MSEILMILQAILIVVIVLTSVTSAILLKLLRYNWEGREDQSKVVAPSIEPTMYEYEGPLLDLNGISVNKEKGEEE